MAFTATFECRCAVCWKSFAKGVGATGWALRFGRKWLILANDELPSERVTSLEILNVLYSSDAFLNRRDVDDTCVLIGIRADEPLNGVVEVLGLGLGFVFFWDWLVVGLLSFFREASQEAEDENDGCRGFER